MRKAFIVTLDLPLGSTVEEIAKYIEGAIAEMKGCLPSNNLIKQLNDETIRVTSITDEQAQVIELWEIKMDCPKCIEKAKENPNHIIQQAHPLYNGKCEDCWLECNKTKPYTYGSQGDKEEITNN